jgi:hypothetical protein
VPISYITNLYNALLKASVVFTFGTPIGTGVTAEAEESKPGTVDPIKATAREYHGVILSQKVRLTSARVTKYMVLLQPIIQ